MKTEKWASHPKYTQYLISTYGRIIGPRGSLLKLQLKGKGTTKYYCIGIRHGKIMKWPSVHKLVLETFIGPKPKGMECLHGEKGKLCNRLDNLSWGTHSKNCSVDKLRDGTLQTAKLTPNDVKQIRQRREAGEKVLAIAEDYCVSGPTISQAVLGDTWKFI